MSNRSKALDGRAKKAVILARVSTREQEDGYSIDAQLHRLNAYCDQKGLDVLETFIITESSTVGDREKFMEMIAYIKRQRKPIALIADKVDRVQRSFREYPLLDDLIKSGKMELHFRTENYVIHRNSVSNERMMWSFGVMMAMSYNDNMRDNIRRGMEQKLRQGEWGHMAPLGYLNVKNEHGKSWIVIDPERALLVRRMFTEFATGTYTLGEIVQKTKEWGLKNTRGLKGHLCKSHVHKMLTNPFYYGQMLVKGETHDHVYEPIVERQIWQKCQDALARWHKKPFQYGKLEFVFRGLITCAISGRTVSSERKRKTYKNGKKVQWIYLSCANPENPKKKIWVREEKVLEQIETAFGRLCVPEPLLEKIRQYILETDVVERDFLRRQLKELEREKHSLLNRLDNLIELVSDDVITRDDYLRQRKNLDTQMHDVDTQIKAHTSSNGAFKDKVVDLFTLTANSAQAFRGSNTSRKRQLINLVFSNLQLKGDKLLFSLNKPFDLMLDLSKCQEWSERVDALRTFPIHPDEVNYLFERLDMIIMGECYA